MTKIFLVFSFWILFAPVFGQFNFLRSFTTDSTSILSYKIDSVQFFIKTKENNEWNYISSNENKIMLQYGFYQIKLIEYVKDKKDSIEFEFDVKPKIHTVELNVDVKLKTTARISMIKNVVSKNYDTTYVNQISLYQIETMPKKVKIITLKDSNTKFIVKNKMSESLYGLGDSTMFYGTLFKKTEDGWNYRALNVSLLKDSYQINPGESHFAGTNEMQLNKDFNVSNGCYKYSIYLSNKPIDFTYMKIEKVVDKKKSSFSDFFDSKSTNSNTGENLIKFNWEIRTISFYNYKTELKMPAANKR